MTEPALNRHRPSMTSRFPTTIPLVTRVTCPHCWERFSPDAALWVAQHPELLGDPRLGSDHYLRFLPTRFALSGAAIDAKGSVCNLLACPRCHLKIPRAMFEMPGVFVSLFGGPASGKSYLLSAMTWQLRRLLPEYFQLGFSDADPEMNLRLQQYESLQFLNPNPNELARIEKTEQKGSMFYDSVQFGEQKVEYPRPILFSMAPLAGHPNFEQAAAIANVLCLYDNAGESFQPGEDTAASPVTQHLAQSRVLLFAFDPTQDVRFRHACHGRTNDPQMVERAERLPHEGAVRQDAILVEAARRIRHHAGLAETSRHSRPLIVIVTKFDCWASLLSEEPLQHLCVTDPSNRRSAVRIGEIERVSLVLRELLVRLTPELVAAAEGFAHEVLYVPASATGCSPEVDPRDGQLKIRPRDLRPLWVEAPLLYSLSKWMRGLVPFVREPQNDGQVDVVAPAGSSERLA